MAGTFQSLDVRTSWGTIRITLQQGKVVECSLPKLIEEPAVSFRLISAGTDPVSQFIVSVFSGIPARLPALGNLNGTDFQSRVWKSIAAIERGRTLSYSALACAIGQPTACRAAARACGKNPVPLFIPCHRVVGANGSIGGFSAGTPWKRLLLSIER